MVLDIKSQDKMVPYKVGDHLETPEELDVNLDACINESEGDAVSIAQTFEEIARAKGITQIA
jgi:DNA-binding phage protein